MKMKKLVSGIAALAMAVSAFSAMSITASAAGYTLSLTDSFEVTGYVAETLYDFTSNTPEVLPTEGDLRYREGFGLHNYGSGSRTATATIPVSSGDILVLQVYNTKNDAVLNSVSSCTLNSSLTSTYGYQIYDVNSDAESITFSSPRYGGIVGALVMSEDNTVTKAEYTVNYVCGTTTIDTVSDEGVVGEVPAFDKSDKYDTAGVKYSYVSDDSESVGGVSSEGTTVYTLTYKEVSTYTATVNAVVDGTTIKTYTKTAYEGETATVYYSKYIEYNGVYYVTEANGSYPSYAKSFTEAGSADVTYTASDVTYAAEIESLEPSHSWAATGATPTRYSNGDAKRLYKSSYVKLGWTASEDSNVTVALWARNQSSSSTASISVYTVDSEGTLTDTGVDLGSWATGACTELSAEVTVPAGSAVVIYNDGDYNTNLEADYVTLTATAVETDTEEAAYAFDTTTSEIADQSIYVTATQNGTALTTIPYAVSNVLDAEALSGNLKFGLIITDIPTDVTIESVVIK